MIYMVDHIYDDAATEPAWHAWYAGYLHKLLSVPGIHSAQRFKAVGCTPPRYLAMYSIDSLDVYSSEGYKKIGGGGSQSASFHHAYGLWTRNLFAGAERAPAVHAGQRVVVFDRAAREENNPYGARAVWLNSVGLHMTTTYRAYAVLDGAEATAANAPAGGYVYELFTPAMLCQ